MDLKLELIQNHICDMIKNIFQSDFDANQIADSNAILILDKIKKITSDDSLSDFDAIEEIVYLLEENNIDCGPRHDF